MPSSIVTRAVAVEDLNEISDLHARAFGPGRFARSAYRVREGSASVSGHCRAAFLDARMVAALTFTAVKIGESSGALLLGPLAVDPDFAGQGHGQRLVREGLQLAKAEGIRVIVLVGDEPYYGRFGFVRVPPGQIVFPGPVNPARILAAELQRDALKDFQGLVRAHAIQS